MPRTYLADVLGEEAHAVRLVDAVAVVELREHVLQGHGRVARLAAPDGGDAAQHQHLDALPGHAQVHQVALLVQPAAAGAARHLRRHERREQLRVVAHEGGGAEGHVDTVGQGGVREDHRQLALLRQLLHDAPVLLRVRVVHVQPEAAPQGLHVRVLPRHVVLRQLLCAHDRVREEQMREEGEHVPVIKLAAGTSR